MDKKKDISKVGFGISLVGFLLCFIPYLGVVGISLGLFGAFFSYASYRYAKQVDGPTLLSSMGILMGVTSMLVGGYQYYKVKPAFDTISAVRNKKNEGLVRLMKHVLIGEDEKVTATLDKVFPERHNEYFISVVEKLRIREEPNLSSKTVGHLEYGDVAESLRESSPHKDSIVIGGELRYATWQKISATLSYQSAPVIGWVYGGAVVKPTNASIRFTDDIYLKTFLNASASVVSSLTGLEIAGDDKFQGVVQIKENLKGPYIKHGPFRIIRSILDKSDDMYNYHNVEYTGNFKDNKWDGLYTRRSAFRENSDLLQINYKDGVCTSFFLETTSEETMQRNEEQNPSDCSIDYMYSGLKEVPFEYEN